jgi:hypothetical protein
LSAGVHFEKSGSQSNVSPGLAAVLAEADAAAVGSNEDVKREI